MAWHMANKLNMAANSAPERCAHNIAVTQQKRDPSYTGYVIKTQ